MPELCSKRLWWLAAALTLVLAACGGGDGDGDAADGGGSASEGASEVAIDNFSFMPPDVEVAAGTEVTWTNQDDVAHTVQDDAELFPESEELASGETFSFTYDTAGEYPYICGIHPYMKGTVTVS
jgi:plastocyanin